MINLKFLTLIIGSLFIFLYTLKVFRNLLEKNLNSSYKTIILKTTNNIHISFILGLLLTTLLTSSSAITAITISFLSAKIINKKSALAILLGANIGTTITPLLFSINITSYSFVLFLLSLLFYVFKKPFLSQIFVCTAVLFFSLLLLQDSLSNATSLISGFTYTSPILSFFEGILFSMLINSSSTTIITSSILYNINSIPIYNALGIMLGANVGTTINTLMFIPKNNKDCLDITLINITYNIIGSFFFLIFLDFFVILIYIFPKTFQISIAHIIFNISTTLITYLILILTSKKTLTLNRHL